MKLEFRGIHQDILALALDHERHPSDITPEYDVEGSLNCGKTTMAIWRQLDKLARYPGIWAFAFRYSDSDTSRLLKPAIELICNLRGETPKWDSKEMCYHFDNTSRLYSFGLKSVDLLSRYSKLRGLGVSDIYNDQSEELPGDLAGELRARLRPDLRMTLMQQVFPRALMLTPNPAGHRHWLTRDYPADNSIKGRYYFSLPVYANEHNIGAAAVRSLESSFPPGHARHATMVLGQRGMNVIGDPIFEDSFRRDLHLKPAAFNPDELLYEVFDVGKHCPCWMAAQRGYAGGWTYLGGILGQDTFLEDFLPVVKQQRKDWFGELKPTQVRTCYARSGSDGDAQQVRYTDIRLLRDAGFFIVTRQHGNSPDVLLAMIELLAGYMRRRDRRGQECLCVNDAPDQWVRLSKEGIEPCSFLADGFEAGMVWSPHEVSVGRQKVRQLEEDDWFEHPLKCATALELNFGADQLTQEQREERRQGQAERRSNMPDDAPSSDTSWLGY